MNSNVLELPIGELAGPALEYRAIELAHRNRVAAWLEAQIASRVKPYRRERAPVRTEELSFAT